GLVGKPIAPITSKVQGCGLPDGVELTQISGIPLSIPIQVDCNTAVRMKYWVDNGIVPAIGNRGGGISRLEIAGSYACRPRNNQSGAKVSEHGRGHAVDLRGIRLKSGQVMTVEDDWRGYDNVLQRIHAAACGPFGTVLGPQSDAYHHDHIHVDTAQNRNGASYCH
ncbi:MAG TPA: extensin family protein, partial [Paenirhodobacter sp.]